MSFHVRVLTDPKKVTEIRPFWNSCIEHCSDSPFFLSGFIEHFMEFNLSLGWTPFVLVVSLDRRIVGMAPFMHKKLFGFPVLRSLHWPAFSPDIVANEGLIDDAAESIINFLFRNLRQKFVDICLPSESPSIHALERKCSEMGVYFSAKKMVELGHRFLRVFGDWNVYLSSRGGNFRRKIRKMEKKLGARGTYRITCHDNPEFDSTIVNSVLDVEASSWKEAWRKATGTEVDPTLMMILKASREMASCDPNFKWRVWFLELADAVLSYSIVLEYSKVAYIVKTSYKNQYRALYPGIYLINSVLREIFDKAEVELVDFQTDMQFMDTWNAGQLSRSRVVMADGIMPTILAKVLTSRHSARIGEKIIGPLQSRVPSITDFVPWSAR